jgi:glutamate-1-semialdehyde 2,1-aminomutase
MARSGQGAWLTDECGVRILDCNNNYTTLVHGHCFEPVQRAVTEALKNGTSFGLPTRREVVLAEHLRDRTGHDQWRFCNSGTEAVMQAIRCARAVTGRDVIVRFQGSYHGTSDPVTDFDKPGITNAERAAVIVLPHGDRSSLRELFDTSGSEDRRGPHRPHAEPRWPPTADPEFVNAVRELTARNGSLMIVDEVITFRLAFSGLCLTYGITADLATFGKLIGGGLPVGALAGRADVMAAFDSKSGPANRVGRHIQRQPAHHGRGSGGRRCLRSERPRPTQ